ncbi:IQ domain-containing protein K-like isoform X2 [Mercenaria mercenaria]|uniref:IQ domain-containing protein K-like isoform X2 n=1 Tax=Mercenaria mercenaria TaxID=6596 RepID=UPI001E1D5688|nr:IQ domain-containing protein K-like isoform X2 [Mercenaria mercenaria]
MAKFSGFKQYREDDEVSVATDYQDYDPAKHNPVFYGRMHSRVPVDCDPREDVDPAVIHPSVIGYSFTEKPPKTPPPPPPPVPSKEECSPREYLQHYVFPVLVPAMEEMLKQAKTEKCFERKRTKFNALDYVTAFLYNHNPNKLERTKTELEDIPFVQEWLKDHPRPPLPLSLIWTEEEAALIIQSFWRGYLVRREPEVQELRQWQAEWREELGGIKRRVSDFWEKKMPESPKASQDNLNTDNKTEEVEPAKSS